MLPPELVKQIRLLEIRTNRVVEEITGGAYRSVFKGRGMEFDEVREYSPEDDVRDIDWNVTARMNSAYIKKYIEERELNVLFLVDVSASGAFGSAEKNKRTTAAQLAALLAFSAGKNGDKVGLMMFSDKIELYVPPKSGRTHSLRLIREMLAFQPQNKGTDINLALKESFSLLKKKSVIFLLSDLISPTSFEASLKILNKKHDVVAIQIVDPTELHWPESSPLYVEDAESGEIIPFYGGEKKRVELDLALSENKKTNQDICRRSKVDLIEVESGGDVLKPLINFFAHRKTNRMSSGKGAK